MIQHPWINDDWGYPPDSPNNTSHPNYKTFDEKAQIAIEKRLEAEREWMEFIVSVGAGRIKETTHDRFIRTQKMLDEERRLEAQTKSDVRPPEGED